MPRNARDWMHRQSFAHNYHHQHDVKRADLTCLKKDLFLGNYTPVVNDWVTLFFGYTTIITIISKYPSSGSDSILPNQITDEPRSWTDTSHSSNKEMIHTNVTLDKFFERIQQRPTLYNHKHNTD